MSNWLKVQRECLGASLRSIKSKQRLVITQPFFDFDETITDVDVLWADENAFKNDSSFRADIFFNQGYSPDRERLLYVRGEERANLHVTWFWDNHHLFADTVHSAVLSDVYFYAHGYCSSYISNPFSVDGGFVPLCPIFWKSKEVIEAANRSLFNERSDSLYGGYNSYPEFAERDVTLKRIMANIPGHNLFITPHGTPSNQHPYYGMTPVERLLEWMGYKVSLCLSFGGNTAIRIFDMLLAGGIPLIVGKPHDLDSIIPPDLQRQLPVIIIENDSPEAIRTAYEAAVRSFDEMGKEGVAARHNYIVKNHMPKNRLEQMVNYIRELAEKVD
jgi:hypothetical protein